MGEADGRGRTRGAYLEYGGALVSGGFLVGCTGESDPGSASEPTDTATGVPTETETNASTETPAGTGTSTTERPTKSRAAFRNTAVDLLDSHSTASEPTAVKNGDVYRAGGPYRGPITNVALTERTAGELYGFGGGLFDRERVAAVVSEEV